MRPHPDSQQSTSPHTLESNLLSDHQFTNSSLETVISSQLQTIGDPTNSSPIAPRAAAAEPQRSPTTQEEAANLILQCSTWVELAQRVSKNASSLLAATKTMTQEQRRSLTHLLATHLCQNPAELSAIAWVPMKLRDRALDSLTFTIGRIGGKANSVLDACLEYISGCKFVSVQQLGTPQEIWTFQTLEGKKIPVFGTEAIEAISLV